MYFNKKQLRHKQLILGIKYLKHNLLIFCIKLKSRIVDKLHFPTTLCEFKYMLIYGAIQND